jgi:hypothetical protein
LTRPDDEASKRRQCYSIAFLQRRLDAVQNQIDDFTYLTPRKLGLCGDGVNHIRFRQPRISCSGTIDLSL